MPQLTLIMRSPLPAGLAPAQSVKAAVTMLFEMVRDGELTVDGALECLEFEPETRPAPISMEDLSEEEPLRFKFASDRDALLLMFRLVHDKVHPVEKVVECLRIPE
jgi:hypothetical protein